MASGTSGPATSATPAAAHAGALDTTSLSVLWAGALAQQVADELGMATAAYGMFNFDVHWVLLTDFNYRKTARGGEGPVDFLVLQDLHGGDLSEQWPLGAVAGRRVLHRISGTRKLHGFYNHEPEPGEIDIPDLDPDTATVDTSDSPVTSTSTSEDAGISDFFTELILGGKDVTGEVRLDVHLETQGTYLDPATATERVVPGSVDVEGAGFQLPINLTGFCPPPGRDWFVEEYVGFVYVDVGIFDRSWNGHVFLGSYPVFVEVFASNPVVAFVAEGVFQSWVQVVMLLQDKACGEPVCSVPVSYYVAWMQFRQAMGAFDAVCASAGCETWLLEALGGTPSPIGVEPIDASACPECA